MKCMKYKKRWGFSVNIPENLHDLWFNFTHPSSIGVAAFIIFAILLVLAIIFIPLVSALHDYGIFHILSIICFLTFLYLVINKKKKHN